METINYKNLKGEDLFTYFTTDHPDKEYSGVVALLPYAVEDWQEALSLLERVVKQGKRFVAIYPELDSVDVSSLEKVGQIPDGFLFIE
jgi:hypothetical protein